MRRVKRLIKDSKKRKKMKKHKKHKKMNIIRLIISYKLRTNRLLPKMQQTREKNTDKCLA